MLDYTVMCLYLIITDVHLRPYHIIIDGIVHSARTHVRLSRLIPGWCVFMNVSSDLVLHVGVGVSCGLFIRSGIISRRS